MAGMCITHGEMGNAYRTLVRNFEEKRLFVRLMRRWDDNDMILLNE
jgi:hypothetical protein